jgi:CP family cyanate transporter-like MFS transporter
LSLANGVGIAGSLVAPVVAARLRAQTAVAVAATGVTALGLLGTLLLPGAEIVSMAVFGIGQGAALGIALTLIVLRAPDGAHASQLSGMAQSMGYLLAASGPFMLGALHDLTDSWTVPLVVLLALLAPQALSGGLAGRERFVARRRAPSSGL